MSYPVESQSQGSATEYLALRVQRVSKLYFADEVIWSLRFGYVKVFKLYFTWPLPWDQCERGDSTRGWCLTQHRLQIHKSTQASPTEGITFSRSLQCSQSIWLLIEMLVVCTQWKWANTCETTNGGHRFVNDYNMLYIYDIDCLFYCQPLKMQGCVKSHWTIVVPNYGTCPFVSLHIC